MRTWILGLFAASIVAFAVPAQAVTVDDVIGLTRAKASDAIIMAKIEADQTVFHLTVQEILDLKEAGVSDAVITYMINTGKSDQEPQAAAPQDTTTEDQNVQPADSGSGGTSEPDYATDLDSTYRTNVYVSYGFYYPHWPGYWYSYYYDPFWWPSLSFYWCYWQPFPYYYAYYDPWYYCNPWNVWYYTGCYGGGYHHHHNYPNYTVYANNDFPNIKDRNIGNRGPDSGTRVVKGRSPQAPDVRSPVTGTLKPTTPSPGRVLVKGGDQASGEWTMPPQNRRPARIDTQRPERGRVTTQPAPTRRVPEARGRSDSPRPSQGRGQVSPPAPRSGKVKENPPPPQRNDRSVQRPSRNDNRDSGRSYAPPSRGSSRSNGSAPQRSSGSQSSGGRTKKGGS